MKVCSNCGIEIATRDGDNQCIKCENLDGDKRKLSRERAKAKRKANDAILRSLGLKRVRGAMGGIYWE